MSQTHNLLAVCYGVLPWLAAWCHAAAAQDSVATPVEGPPAIRLNSIGFLPDAPKRATVTLASAPFQVLRFSDQSVVHTGKSSSGVLNPDTDEHLSTIDFTDLREPGRYVIEIESVGMSPPFVIGPDVYNDVFRTAARAMYMMRCGVAVEGEHAGKTYSHEACHLDDAYTDFLGEPGGKRDAVGGWHDAGDYNKYVVNAGITVGMLLQAWEHHADRLQQIGLELPEPDDGTPDFLDEIRWEMEWLLKTQLSDGSVSHKVSTQEFGGFIAPEKEDTKRYFTPWTSASTADFVAMCAGTARIFRDYDPQFADRCLSAAQKSYEFLAAHPDFHPADHRGFSTGGYDTHDDDDRLWAAAELWEATGKEAYLRDFETRIKSIIASSDAPVVDFDWDWGDISNLAMFAYVNSERAGRCQEILTRVKQDIVAVADKIVATTAEHGYARPLGNRYYWGCNGTVARLSMVLHVANKIQPNPAYREAQLAAVDYLFGRNYYGRSFVTGLGYKPPMHPHDRRNGINGFPDPWPGNLVGGGWPTGRDWHDDQEDYRTNEIAINWNGALIYALAAFVEPATIKPVE